jgi:polyhydroxyalkanoate synthesis regulator phasin
MPRGDDKRSTRADAVRAAVDQAFQATAGQAQVTRDRAAEIADEIADELSAAAGRVRGAIGALDDLRPSAGEELDTMRERVAALEAKVATLEQAAAPAGDGAAATRRRTAKTPAKRTS